MAGCCADSLVGVVVDDNLSALGPLNSRSIFNPNYRDVEVYQHHVFFKRKMTTSSSMKGTAGTEIITGGVLPILGSANVEAKVAFTIKSVMSCLLGW